MVAVLIICAAVVMVSAMITACTYAGMRSKERREMRRMANQHGLDLERLRLEADRELSHQIAAIKSPNALDAPDSREADRVLAKGLSTRPRDAQGVWQVIRASEVEVGDHLRLSFVDKNKLEMIWKSESPSALNLFYGLTQVERMIR